VCSHVQVESLLSLTVRAHAACQDLPCKTRSLITTVASLYLARHIGVCSLKQ